MLFSLRNRLFFVLVVIVVSHQIGEIYLRVYIFVFEILMTIDTDDLRQKYLKR